MCFHRYPDSLYHYAVHFAASSALALPLLLGVAWHLLRRAALYMTRPLRSGDDVLCGVVTATNPLPMFSLTLRLPD